MFKKIGPGVLIAAAFIGPGTVTACTLAGVTFGYSLLWAMLLSVIATIVLQEMAARLGIVTQKGLAEVIREELRTPALRYSVIGIILAAIVVGNAAYEAGNIGGATLGLEAIFGDNLLWFYPYVIGGVAFVLLYLGSYKALEKVFISLVLVMSFSFLITAIITRPDLEAVIKGLFMPSVPENSILTIIALVGTTVVPYNLFLHASLVSEKWKSAADLEYAKRDTLLSVGLGGLVSMAIIVAATAITSQEVTNVFGLAEGLEPLFGKAARYFLGVGLFAAGITSAITAPLAAAYVASSCFGWKTDLKGLKFRLVWIFILITGVFSLSLEITPLEIIKFAQVANGILLPLIAVFLLWIVNRSGVMGKFRNTIWHNIMSVFILGLAMVLGVKSVFAVFGLL
ncbi:MAG: Nramp family divalent metal transporter [Eudoraea sp.]|nr:Nramp family divalent metal transporter [Eudoraea sp.]